MKAISIKEPWLQLIIDGHKTVEFRTWKPRKHIVVGWDLLLCASQSIDKTMGLGGLAQWYRGQNAVCEASQKSMSARGMARAIVRIKRIVLATIEEHGKQPGFSYHPNVKPPYAWELENIRPLHDTFSVKGKLGIYEIPIPEGVTL